MTRLILALTLAAATPAFARSPVDCSKYTAPTPLKICRALNRLQAGDESRVRFTRFDLLHNEIHVNGELTRDEHKLFEDTWINDLPYQRLVEVGGKPLAGKELEAEQERYDKAVADRRALDMAERAKLTGGRSFWIVIDLAATLSDAYRIVKAEPQTCDGAAGTHMVAEPTGKPGPDGKVATRRIELWITDAEPMLASWSYELLKDETEQQRGSSGRVEYMMFDGVPVSKHALFIGRRREGVFRKVEIRSDYTYDRYRRFATSVTIRPLDDGGTQPPR